MSENRFRTHVERLHGLRASGRGDIAQVISAVADVDVSMLVRAHSLVPLHGAVLGTVAGDWSDSSGHCWQLRQLSMNRRGCSPYACEDCIREDLDFWGFTYWRRAHQIPGVLWCPKHHSPLFRAERLRSWQLMPHEAPASADQPHRTWLAHAQGTAVLQRYADVCLELLTWPRPMSTLQVVHALAQRGRSIGLDIDAATPLSGMAREQLMEPLREALLPRCKGQRSPYQIDGTLNRMLPVLGGTDYALAIALLYDTADDGLRDVVAAAPTAQAVLVDLQRRSQNVHAAALTKNPVPEAYANAAAEILRGAGVSQAAKSAGTSALAFEKFLREQAVEPAHHRHRARQPQKKGQTPPIRSSYRWS